jgi:hypothetical protein
MIKRSALPKSIVTKLLGDTKLERSLTGCLERQEVVRMQDIRLPEFNKNRRINQQKVLVFDNDNVKYDIILGTIFLSKTRIKLNYSEGNMEWFDCSIPLQKVLVFDNDNVKYNIILGTNFLSKTRIKLNYSEGNMLEWFDFSIPLPLHTPGGLDSKEFNALEDMFHIQVKDKIFGEDWLACFAIEILDAKYEKTDAAEVVKGLTHLNTHQKADLL